MKRSVTLILFLSVLTSLYGQNKNISYSFFVAGHTYNNTPGTSKKGFHPPFKAKFGYIKHRPEIELGILTGDIVFSSTDINWDEIDNEIDSLGLPIYIAAGNHDIANRSLFESRYGKTYFSFLHHNDLFIVLDPNINEWNITGPQLLFLKDVLKQYAASSNNIYVFFHQVLWRESDNDFNYIDYNSTEGRGDSTNFWPEVAPIFHCLLNNVTMFAGDLGTPWASNVTYDKYDNLTLIASGMGDTDGENFIVANVHHNKSISYEVICLSDTNINCLGKIEDHIVVNKNSHLNESLFSIHPNPATSSTTISLNKLSTNQSLQLFNIHGALILEEKTENKCKYIIDLSNIPSGMYIAKLTDGLEQSTIKLIKE